jgi:hypothetical protein
VLGLGGVLHHPSAFMALDPRYGLTYLFTHGFSGFLVLGAVFYVRPALKPSMPIWVISDHAQSDWHGMVWYCPCSCSIMRVRPRW